MNVSPRVPAQVHDEKVTRILLLYGLAAGPLFLSVAITQALTRAGFSLAHQPLSFLSLGELGWVQQLNFVLSGILIMSLAAGTYRSFRHVTVGLLGALCLLGLSVGLIIAGLYPPDPGFGYPGGTPDGPPVRLTHQSAMHGLGFMLSFGFFALACVVLAIGDIKAGRRRQASYTLLSAIAALTLGMWPGTGAIALRDLAAAVTLWTWVTVHAARLLRR